jgi:hypothetical protein
MAAEGKGGGMREQCGTQKVFFSSCYSSIFQKEFLLVSYRSKESTIAISSIYFVCDYFRQFSRNG